MSEKIIQRLIDGKIGCHPTQEEKDIIFETVKKQSEELVSIAGKKK